MLKRGVEVEKEKLPRAATVIARRNEKDVQTRAVATYRKYDYDRDEALGRNHIDWMDDGDFLLSGIPISVDQETHLAYVQLGSCLVNNINPVPTAVK
jgi:hypothetical protein